MSVAHRISAPPYQGSEEEMPTVYSAFNGDRLLTELPELPRLTEQPALPEQHKLAVLPEQHELEDQSDLLTAIETTLIPKLLLAHRADPLSSSLCGKARLPPTAEEIFEFARIAACHDLNGALAFIESMCRRGYSIEDILIELVSPCARLLGEQWLADLRSFTEVSAGLGTLQQVVHVLSPSMQSALPHGGLIVLVAVPGEQHTLGLFLIGEFLRRAGFRVHIDPAMSESELVALLAAEKVDLLGISVSNTGLLDSLGTLIAVARGASCNPDLTIMLGGSLDLGVYAEQHGALVFAADPREVVRWLQRHAKFNLCRS